MENHCGKVYLFFEEIQELEHWETMVNSCMIDFDVDIYNIAERNHVRDIEQLKRVIFYLIANVGNTFSASSVMKYLKNEKRSMSTETLYNYLDYCQTSCILHLVSRENVMGKELLRSQEKIYLADHGLREAIYGNNLRDINQTLENIVYMELLRRGYMVTVGKAASKEVGFVAKDGADRL